MSTYGATLNLQLHYAIFIGSSRRVEKVGKSILPRNWVQFPSLGNFTREKSDALWALNNAAAFNRAVTERSTGIQQSQPQLAITRCYGSELARKLQLSFMKLEAFVPNRYYIVR